MDIGYLVTVISVVLISMMLHELMHGFVAYKLGDDTARLLGRLSFNPLKHIDPFMTIMLPLLIAVTNMLTGSHMPIFGGAKPVPFNPANIKYGEWGVALVAAVGPLINLLLAFLSYAILIKTGVAIDGPVGEILKIATWVNLGFFVFNMLPLPPLDGSRILYALAPDFVRRGMEVIEQYGTLLVLAFVLLFTGVISTYMITAINVILQVFTTILGVAS